MFAGNSAGKDLPAEPTLSSDARTTDLCSAGSLFFAMLHTRMQNLEAERAEPDSDLVCAGCLLQPGQDEKRV